MNITVEEAIKALQDKGHHVERADFPPPPLPGLYNVNGEYRDITEKQLIGLSWQIGPKSRD